MSNTTRSTDPRNRSWRKKLVFSLVTTSGFFLLFELGLRLVGVQPVTETRDPFAGFSQIPLLTSVAGDKGQQVLTTADSKLVWFNAQTFPRHKRPGSCRVFCVGGSTTYGRPYWDLTSYCGWLRELLPVVDDSCEWEVINAGGVSYASYRVAAVMDELAQYEPDLFIVYSAHNEFLERRTYEGMFERSPLQMRLSAALSQTRTWALLDRVIKRRDDITPTTPSDRLPEEVDELLNHTVGPSDYHRDDKWRHDVLEHYELNLQQMARIAKRSGASIVFVTPASNEKDCSPFKSEPRISLEAAQRRQLQSHVERAEQQLAAAQFEDALTVLEQARAIDDVYALSYYLEGKASFALGRMEQASVAFDRALDQDVCPLRAVPEITETIRRVARQQRVPVVEFGDSLKARCQQEFGHRCLGDEYFLDHVHPTIDIHRQLALWIIATLQEKGIIRGDAPPDEAVRVVADRIGSQIDGTAQGVALRNLAKLMHWAGRFDEAAGHAAGALRLIEDDLESQFLLAECLRQKGRTDEAMSEFERLFALEPDYERGYIPFGKLLADGGHLAAAKIYLSMGIYLHPERDDAHYALGAVHFQSGEYELAKEALLEASRLNSSQSGTLLLLARANVAAGDLIAAVAAYEQALRVTSDNADAHNELGEVLLQLGRAKAAAAQFLAALTINPGHEDAHFNLEAVREGLGL